MRASQFPLRVLLVFIIVFYQQPVHAASKDYGDLVALFREFRDYQQAAMSDGVPDYSPAAIAGSLSRLEGYRAALSGIDTSAWPVWQQVDYHLVRAEMNAVEFQHKVQRPWARDPGFYSMFEGDAGATANAPEFFGPVLAVLDHSDDGPGPPGDRGAAAKLTASEASSLEATLRSIPDFYRQARSNLTEPVADLAEFAVRNFSEESSAYEAIAKRLEEHHPKLAMAARSAGQAIEDYRQWVAGNLGDMAPNAGLGKDNYDWWMRNVQLSPWGWEESNLIIHTEYNRIITFLKLEEHRNRNLPELAVAMSDKAWNDSMVQALRHVVDFLRDEEIMTIPEWVNPADYHAEGLRGAGSETDDTLSEELLPENTSIDTKVRQREILPGETHEYIGHMLDYQRQERLTKSPIRSAGRRFNMGSMRLEGWAVALEELLMQAGVLDDRPRRGRIMAYLMNASHMSLAIPDMKMHANEISLAEARKLCAEIMPRGWSREDEDMVWFEMQSNLRNPGGFHSNVVTGKAYFMKLFREAAQEKDEEFVVRDFVDQFLSSGTIPMSLIRWEMTGNNSDVTLVTEKL